MPNNARLLLLDRDQVASLLQPDEVLAAVHEAFVLHSRGEGRVFPLVREKLATGGVFGIKSGDVPAQNLLGFKAAGFWPGNRAVGGEPHQATIFLMNPATGRPECLIDGNEVTTQRTGAAGGLGIRHLARPDSQRVCVFGTGVQARVQLEFALRVMPSLREVRYLSSNRKPNAAFEALFGSRCTVLHALDANDAVASSELVIAATTGKGPLFDASAVQPGTHINGVGTDTQGKRELPDGLLSRARVFVDDAAQSLSIGELQWAPATPLVEIGDVLSGKTPFKRALDDITVFDMTGIALQDLTVARLLYQGALSTGTGTSIAWPW